MTVTELCRKDKFDNVMLTKLLKRKLELLESIQTLKPNQLEIVSILYIFHMCK
jgi:hypothetical protein